MQDYIPLGIFVFLPARVFVKRGEEQGKAEVNFQDILSAYPSGRIFSACKGNFVEFDRVAGQRDPVTYGQIVPP